VRAYRQWGVDRGQKGRIMLQSQERSSVFRDGLFTGIGAPEEYRGHLVQLVQQTILIDGHPVVKTLCSARLMIPGNTICFCELTKKSTLEEAFGFMDARQGRFA